MSAARVRTRAHPLVALVIAAVAFAAGCGSDDGNASTGSSLGPATTLTSTTDTTATTTSTTSTTTSTTVATTSTTSTTAPATTDGGNQSPGASTPEAAAKGLYDAWKAADRTAAAAVADQTAVDHLFDQPFDDVDHYFYGCFPDGDLIACSYAYEGGSYSFRVHQIGTGYRVVDVVEIAD